MWCAAPPRTGAAPGLFRGVPDRRTGGGRRTALPGRHVAAVLGGVGLVGILAAVSAAYAQGPRVVDVPTRPGVTQRFLYVPADAPVASAILFAGGHGGLAFDASGKPGWGAGNFLVRTRTMFAERGVSVAVIDAPSDRQAPPWLGGFRQTREHAADVTAVVAWLRADAKAPVWLIGTSRGTQSAAALALASTGADGLVLTSTIVVDPRGRPVSAMPVERIAIATLVVHHKDDGCVATPWAQVPALVARLTGAPRKAFVTFEGGIDAGDPCEAAGHHGYAGIEPRVVDSIVAFVVGR